MPKWLGILWSWAAVGLCAPLVCAIAPEGRYLIYPEQRRLEVRSPEAMPSAELPVLPDPPTIAMPALQSWELSLDEAIRIALSNAEVVRVVTGTTAVATGQTIYDPAIENNFIDQERAAFDPEVFSDSRITRTETPLGSANPLDPLDVSVRGFTNDTFRNSTGLRKDFATGGTFAVQADAANDRYRSPTAPLNPVGALQTEVGVTQPLLQGAGARVNLAPVLIARINTERSFFQLKGSVQDLVATTISAYWNLAVAKVNVSARRRQVEQGLEALERATKRHELELVDVSEPAQARVAYENFRATLVAAEADLLNQEAALRNVLGLPPADGRRIEPITPLSTAPYAGDFGYLRSLAETYRPDLIQLKLILENDEQQLILARNRALPQLDAEAAYRWNDLEGRTPGGLWLETGPGQYTGWNYGLNFSLPLGQRSARAQLRQRELALMRDRANLTQGLHAANHELAASVRNLAQFYRQYQLYQYTREAARINYERQLAANQQDKAILLNVLQAITDWGNAVANESQAIANYNAELANLERVTGTILESRGVRFVDELYGSLGPLGRFQAPVCYPRSTAPGPNAPLPPPAENERYSPDQVMRLPPITPERLPPPEPEPGEKP